MKNQRSTLDDRCLTDYATEERPAKKGAGKNILMMCYYYPPLLDVGCKRSVAFSKYFRKHGWTPVVLSVKNPDKAFCIIGNDQPPEGVYTEYTYSVINPYKFLGKVNGAIARMLKLFHITLKRNYFYDIFCIPDHLIGWVPLAVLAGMRLVKRHDIDMIYVSSPPWSSALAGVLLKKITGRKLILDARDPYGLESMFAQEMPTFRRRVNRRVKEYFLKHADLFIVTTDGLRKEYIRQYPHIEGKIFVVHNGYDPDYSPELGQDKYEKFTIIYTGNFYSNAHRLSVYTDVFFEALADLKSRGEVHSGNFQFLYFGHEKGYIEKEAEKHAVRDLVKASSNIPYTEALRAITRSHLQLLRILNPMISTKLFEGLALNIPFLATIPNGEAEELIRRYSPSSYIVMDHSHQEVGYAILDAMKRYDMGDIKPNRAEEFLQEFSRENLSCKLMKIIEEVEG